MSLDMPNLRGDIPSNLQTKNLLRSMGILPVTAISIRLSENAKIDVDVTCPVRPLHFSNKHSHIYETLYTCNLFLSPRCKNKGV